MGQVKMDTSKGESMRKITIEEKENIENIIKLIVMTEHLKERRTCSDRLLKIPDCEICCLDCNKIIYCVEEYLFKKKRVSCVLRRSERMCVSLMLLLDEYLEAKGYDVRHRWY